MAGISFVTVCHIYREANNVTHQLAHLTSKSYIDGFRLDETPYIIEDVFYKDFCKGTRSQGFTSIINNKYYRYLLKKKNKKQKTETSTNN